MKKPEITNETVFDIDWCHADKQALLRRLPRPPKERRLTPGIRVRSVWMIDVSGMDRRSVKAMLAGRGDLRVGWYRLNDFLHRALHPDSSLEQRMFAFHKRHHATTIGILTLQSEILRVARLVRQHGLLTGLLCAIKSARRSDHQQ